MVGVFISVNQRIGAVQFHAESGDMKFLDKAVV